jgi:hypothetical protein
MDDRLIRKIFSEIVASYSLAKLFNDIIFIKHFSSIDLLEFDFKYQNYLKYARERGLATQDERLELLKRDNLWDNGKENLVKELKDHLSSLYESKRNFHSLRDINASNEQIKLSEDKLNELLTDKYNLIGECAENYARRKTDLDQVFGSFYKDSKLTQLIFPEKDEDVLNDDDLNTLIITYNEHLSELDDKNLRYVSVASDFQMMFSMSENLYYFYGVPISKLTHYQVRLANFGAHFKSILQSGQRPPLDIMNNPDAIEDWYYARTNLGKIIEKNEEEGKNVSIVGMSKKELEYLGYDVGSGRKSLKKAARDNGGELSREQMMELGLL